MTDGNGHSLSSSLLRRFRGREDVVFVSKPYIRLERDRAPLTPSEFERRHLSNGERLGFYLMRPDNTVVCSCYDQDNHGGADPDWRAKVERTCTLLLNIGIPFLVEISSSGNGAHVWMFFSEPIPAHLPRLFWRGVFKSLGFEKMPEIFPKQDEITDVGNQTSYPLGGKSHFVDIEHDWSPLDPIKAMTDVREISELELKGAIEFIGPGEPQRQQRATFVNSEITVAELMEMVAAIPSSHAVDYDEWIKVGAAINDKFPNEEGLAAWTEFSRKCPEKFDESVCRRKWSTFSPGGKRTIATVVRLAQLGGWSHPKRQRMIAAPNGSTKGSHFDQRPEIVITANEHAVNDQAIDALARHENIYQRGGILVHIVTDPLEGNGIDRPDGAARIAIVQQPTLRDLFTEVACFRKVVPSGDGGTKLVDAHPPEWCVRASHCRGQYPIKIRPLRSIVANPFLRPDGTIVSTPGYDSATELIYRPIGPAPVLPTNPTMADARRALDQILDVLCDFPFQTEAHRSGMIAAWLTPFARTAFRGCVPFNLIDANTPSVGKTLLAILTGIVWSGGELAVMQNPTCDDEARKRITSLVLSGAMFVHVDNISGPLGGAALEAALTSTKWEDRLLGRNETVKCDNLLTWLGTANNAVILPDMTRRINPIRLFTEFEDPETRTGFRHKNIVEFVTVNRPSLVAACLTILAAYVQAGRPAVKPIPEWGSFPEWSLWVRRPLVWLGLPDPFDAREELKSASDKTRGALADLISALQAFDPEGTGLTSAQIAKHLSDPTGNEPLRDAIFELCGGGPGKPPSVATIGSNIRRFRGRNVGGYCIDSQTERKGAARWFVRALASSASSAETEPGAEHAGLADDKTPRPRGRDHARARAGDAGAGPLTSSASSASSAMEREPGDETENSPVERVTE